MTNVKELAKALEAALLKEADELPNPQTNLLTGNERLLIEFCQRLAAALRASAKRILELEKDLRLAQKHAKEWEALATRSTKS